MKKLALVVLALVAATWLALRLVYGCPGISEKLTVCKRGPCCCPWGAICD